MIAQDPPRIAALIRRQAVVHYHRLEGDNGRDDQARGLPPASLDDLWQLDLKILTFLVEA